ncbi:zinc finger CCCH domain-containing protein 5 isoform X2 [Beta vulgaris subsp. vulgaris]|uniref:zinc finger CCCH domain-containing protein 5 isoform X2 n=1 Tax=Beta vulgaris subsp. vulgaris TaxID=3555 RepID=UPI00203721E4|nr:zinc finger CCCH domain-containing protein 5 isoform X2 [Beta vulgaris subsp. vulgaris]
MAMMKDNQQEMEKEIHNNTIMKSASNDNHNNKDDNSSSITAMSRKEKKKALKKMKRKQIRREIAMKERELEEALLNDPEEEMKLLRLEEEERERMAKDRMEFEERERLFLQALELKKKQQEEEEEHRKVLEQSVKNENANEVNDDDDGWEYVEEGPAEIIWKGNEIIVKKKKIRVPKKTPDIQTEKQGSERPISNPLAPQSEAFDDYRSAQEVLESVAQQVPNFGTEQDKAHCPFHLKTGVCRFGARCSRVHFYPDKACTLLIKNMYSGPGLAWEQDEGLEHTDEEVERSFEDFYEDVHTEFLKFGEIVNFKVCKNGSSHLRGNVYVQYKSLESAVLAYQSNNGRYFAGKQLTCEYVNLTRWRIAICGEFMKSRFKTCSRGSACNFIHCFRNPGADYEWADWDKPAPRYWLKKMAALFGYTGDGFANEVSPGYRSRRSRSMELDSPHRKSFSDEDDSHRRRHLRRHRGDARETRNLDKERREENKNYQDYHRIKHREIDDVYVSEGSTDDQRSLDGMKRSSKKRRGEPNSTRQEDGKSRKAEATTAYYKSADGGESNRYDHHKRRSSSRQKRVVESVIEHCHTRVDNIDLGESSYQGKKRRSQKNVRSSRLNNQSGFTDTDSDRDEDRRHRHSKRHSREMKNDSESSGITFDGDRLGRHGKRPEKSRRRSSGSKKESDLADSKKKREQIGEEKKHHGRRRSEKHHIKEYGLSNDDSNTYRRSRDRDGPIPGEKSKGDAGNFRTDDRCRSSHADVDHNHSEQDNTNDKYREASDRTEVLHNSDVEGGISCRFSDWDKGHDSNNGEMVSERDPEICDIESDEEATASEKAGTCFVNTSCQDFNGEEEAELEKACRHAALKKLEEIRKHKDNTLAAHSREPVESSRCTHENLVVQGSEVSKLETDVASIKRKRI